MTRRLSQDEKRTVAALLERHGRTYCEELGVDIGRNTPSVLFRWLCATVLFSTRISANIAVDAARALAKQGWATPEKLRAASWEERTRVLNRSGYARYDESTSTKLADIADLLNDKYGGDLRKLRKAADADPAEVRRLLREFKGIGPTGADIFCREVQAAWDELFPFADKKALSAAKRLDLGGSAEDLAQLVPRKDFTRFVAALIRTDLARDYEAVQRKAAA